MSWAREVVNSTWQFVIDSWNDHPLVVVGVVITVAFALLVTFRPAR
jgi:hypothetical protein